MKHLFFKKQGCGSVGGSALIEVVVVASILAIVAVALLGSFSLLSRFHERNMMTIKGELLAEEGLEIVRFVKAQRWSVISNIPAGATRYISISTTTSSIWTFTTTPEIVDGIFARSFRVYPVYRDASDDIVSSGGIVDPNIYLIEMSVDWSWRKATTSAVYKTYVTNI